ncbi:MAG: AraC family transcriptional regulator [Lachnospiraceae bacterium]|nr:AraC family transcriptional regulator [Lachnospiraceae bacterium]
MLFSYDAGVLPRVRMLGRVRYSEPWMHFSRQIDEFVLYVIREGNMYIREDGKEYHLKSNDFFLLEPGLLHEGYMKATCDYYYAHFSHSALKRVKDEASAMEELADKRRRTMVSYNLDVEDPTDSITYIPKQFSVREIDFRKILAGAVEEYDAREEHYRNRVSTVLHSFILDLAHEHLLNEWTGKKQITKAEVVAERLIRYLNQNYSKPLTSREIEDRFDVNFDYINRTVSKMTGYTIFAYLNDLRINNAKQLIATTDLPFNEIAYYVGIEDRYYFSKLFKKLAGMTATEYYKRSRER